MWIYVFDFEQTDDITAARQRGEMVLSILEGPILHAGLGMPNVSPDLADSFNNLNLIPDEVLVPVSGDSGDVFQVCYSIPSSAVAESSHDIPSDTSTFQVSMDQVPTNVETGGTIKSWITFPTANTPLNVDTVSGTDLTLIAYSEGSGLIAQYDELHYIRVLEAKVESGTFKVKDVTDSTSSFQSRVDGVEQIYFVNEDGVLSVYVLTRGNKQNVDLADDRDIPGWDESKLPSIDSSSKKYRLSVTKGSWRIRN
jgi:hypothetical protein